jgi:hypothetical protein
MYSIENFALLGPLNKGPVGYPETSVRNYHYLLRNNPEAVLIYYAAKA